LRLSDDLRGELANKLAWVKSELLAPDMEDFVVLDLFEPNNVIWKN
jgi:hypothetical protein